VADPVRLIIHGGADGLPDAPGYYRMFPREPSPAGAMTLSPGMTTVLATGNFEAVLDEMLKASAGDVVMLVCHAYSDGMLLHLTGGSSALIEKGTIERLEKIEAAEKEAGAIGALPSEEKQVAAWKKLIDRLAPGSIQGSFTSAEGQAFYEKWLDVQAGDLRLTGKSPRAVLRRLLDKIKRLRALQLSRVELRACNLGSSDEGMKAAKRLFGCKQLLAPSTGTFFMSRLPVFTLPQLADFFQERAKHPRVRSPNPRGAPALDRRKMLGLLHTGTTRTFTGNELTIIGTIVEGGMGRFGIGLLPVIGPDTTVAVAIEEVSAFHYRGFTAAKGSAGATTPTWKYVAEFLGNFVMPGTSYSSGLFPLAGFWTPDRVWPASVDAEDRVPFLLPNEKQYLDFIKRI
jgi:hypothetical protein